MAQEIDFKLSQEEYERLNLDKPTYEVEGRTYVVRTEAEWLEELHLNF